MVVLVILLITWRTRISFSVCLLAFSVFCVVTASVLLAVCILLSSSLIYHFAFLLQEGADSRPRSSSTSSDPGAGAEAEASAAAPTTKSLEDFSVETLPGKDPVHRLTVSYFSLEFMKRALKQFVMLH